jgi:hypothetical protein
MPTSLAGVTRKTPSGRIIVGPVKQLKSYVRWRSMIVRCSNPNHENYAHYGGRGITVCDRWKQFINFYDDMGEPPDGTVLDRIDTNKGYSPENCRWADFKTSTENRNNTLWVGSSRVNDLAERLSIPASRIYQRLSRGWTEADIISRPGPWRHRGPRKTFVESPTP